MHETVEQGCSGIGVTEDCSPFVEAEIGGDGDADALVKLAQQVEPERPAGGAEQQVGSFAAHHFMCICA